MNYRVMDIDDYEGVYRLWTNTKCMGLNDVDDSPEGIGRYLERNPRTSFICEENGEIVGTIMCGHDGRRGFIHHTAVAEDRRRQGIGRKLVELALEALKNEGISKCALVVFSRNELGNGFWESLGFTVRDDLNYRNMALREIIRNDT